MKPAFFLSCIFLAPCIFAKDPIHTPVGDSVVASIEPYFFKKVLNGRDLDGSIAQHWKDTELQALIKQRDIELFGGPMLGDVTASSAKFWLRATRPGELTVTVKESSVGKPAFRAKASATEENDLVAICINDGGRMGCLRYLASRRRPWDERS